MASIRSNDGPAIASLLDRLRESVEPLGGTADGRARPSSRAPGSSFEELRDSIAENLGWILGTTALSTIRDLSRWPRVRQSVLNFGIDVTAGRNINHSDAHRLAQTTRRAIELFEPRLKRGTVEVVALTQPGDSEHRDIELVILAQCIHREQSRQLRFRATMDWETSQMQLLPT